MASNEEKPFMIVFRDLKENPDGHEINYSFIVHRSDGAEMKLFSLDWETTCTKPSSWSFGFHYQKMPMAGKVICTVTLRRKDNEAHIVEVLALVTFFDADERVARAAECVCSGRMAAGEVKKGEINDNDVADLMNQPLSVRVSVNISKCHGS